MKKILCLIDSLGPGGAQRQLVGLAKFLKIRGYDVQVICYHDNDFYVDDILNNGVPYVFLKKAQSTIFRMWYIARYIRNVNPDIVISYLETPSICACVARIFNNKFKLIVSERNTSQQTERKEKIRFNIFRLADFVVPNAYAQEDYIKQNFPFLSKKTVTIPNFVDLEFFVPPINRSQRTIPEVVVAASIWASKNTLGFIDTVAALKDKGYKFHVSWYGLNTTWLDYIDQCKRKIKSFKLEEYIELKEKTSNIKEVYQDADFFCLPSFYEGTPNVICEAMACGLPVVCSDVCDNPRYVMDGKNGFLFNPRNTDSIVSAFEKLFNLDEKSYKSFCQRSRKKAEEKLSKELFISSYINLINS